jgi:hypothetical protein
VAWESYAAGFGDSVIEQPRLSQSQVPAEISEQNPPIGIEAGDPGQRSSGPYHRVQKSAGGEPVAKLESVCDEPFYTEVFGERPHDVIKSLAHEYYRVVVRHYFS